MPDEALEVFRSDRLADCDEASLVLTAVGVPHEIVQLGAGHALLVEPSAFETASAHLARYAVEKRRPLPRPRPRTPYPRSWVGCAMYCAVLIAVAYAVRRGIGPLDAFDRGELYAAAVQHGQWWRAWTALTLHYGLAHLSGNLGAGVWIGYLAGRELGPGTAWALIVNGGALANLIEGTLAASPHRSAGASTAVFTGLGLLAAFSWRERRSLGEHWAHGWSPLVAGVVLLGWLGTAGTHTDVLAHLLGFLVGVLLGAAIAAPSLQRRLTQTPQWAGGALALGTVAFAWLLALSG